MTSGFPGSFQGGYTTGNMSIGAVQRFKGSSFGFPGTFQKIPTTGYLNIGAVQKANNTSWVNTFSDSATASDTFSNTIGYVNTITDTATSSDTQSVSFAVNAAFTDTATSSDTQSVSFAANATLLDTATASDAYASIMATTATFTDTATASDLFTGGIGYTFTFSDSATASDAISGAMQAAYSFSDTVTASDNFIGGIGYLDFFSDTVAASDAFSAIISPAPNIILSGTLDFGYSYRIPHQISTYLNFPIINNDDNFIQVNITNRVTGAPVGIISVSISIYAPNTISTPILTPVGLPINGGFLFTIPATSAVNLSAGLYPWIAVVTTADGTKHTVNCGDTCLSTGVITVYERPSYGSGCNC